MIHQLLAGNSGVYERSTRPTKITLLRLARQDLRARLPGGQRP
jgi:hypothetical protein